MKFSLPTKNVYLNVPNYFSFARIAFIPLVMIFLGFQYPLHSEKFSPMLGVIASFFFVLAGISDLFDGYYARRMNISGVFGKLIDPLADKLMHMAVMIMLIPLQELPAWLVILFLFREITITALRSVALEDGFVMAADYWGKKKTALLNCSLTCFMLPHRFLWADSRVVGWVVLSLALVVSLGSGVNYLMKYFIPIVEKQSSEK
ncbi:MAG: CDP-diacylglycerol--glycerol-3-phosphate 3-phosphatidyltransferase [Deltaproteobacteria bacterium]|nr:CDP-diacylglycerol--glycerol-3-phosphate 3-phosphatidyltransferase [Deltaproteobacteria bacterium]